MHGNLEEIARSPIISPRITTLEQPVIRSLAGLPLLSLAVVAACLSVAQPASADEDHFTLRLGAIRADGDVRLKGAVELGDSLYGYTSDRIGFGDRTVPRIEGVLHFSNRNRILFNYFRYDRDRNFVLDEDVEVGDDIIPAGSTGSAKARFGLGNLVYDYAFVETPTVSFGLQIGAAWADVEGDIRASDSEIEVNARESESGFAPVIGARLSTNSEDQRWGFTVQGQYLNASWGNFENYKGSITRANALLEYRFTRNFGIFGGYDWFRLNVDHDFGAYRGGLDVRFSGPTAGVTLAF